MQLNKHKKIGKYLIAFTFLLVVGAIFLWPNILLAADLDTGIEYGAQTGLSDQDPRVTVAKIIRIFLGFLGIIAVSLIMYGGWLYMTSEGNEEKITKAKQVIKNAVIGLLIILASFSIVSFIIGRLLGSTSGTGGTGAGGSPNYQSGFGAIGSCAIQTVYPEDYQDEVPRNTAIIVTFKKEIDPATVCDLGDNPAEGAMCNGEDIKMHDGDYNVKIFKKTQEDVCLANEDSCNFAEAKVYSNDNKTFTFIPKEYLGNASEYIWYSTYLSNFITVASNGDGVFDDCSKDYFLWQFEVSNKLDLVPPQVRSVFPAPDNWQDESENVAIGRDDKPRNSIIQINFDEPVMPVVVSGSSADVQDNIRVLSVITDASGAETSQILEGEFYITNLYKTVEFVPTGNPCGTNNCGEKRYCLPGNSEIRVELVAADLASCAGDSDCLNKTPYTTCNGNCQTSTGENYPIAVPLSGITDVSSNSLDGDRDGGVEGPVNFYNENDLYGICNNKICTLEKESVCGGAECSEAAALAGIQDSYGDNYAWSFYVLDIIEEDSPKIYETDPSNSNSGVSLTDPIEVKFNKLIMSSTLQSGSTYVYDELNDLDVEHKYVNLYNFNDNPPDYWITKNNVDTDEDGEDNYTWGYIKHSMFADDSNYRVQLGSGVKDIYQNCFLPCDGPACVGESKTDPSCCSGTVGADDNCN